MSKRTHIYEGKEKTLYEGPEAGTLVMHFKDTTTAFNNSKQGTIDGKGVLNNRISELLMNRLGEMGIMTHFIKSLNMREQLVRAAVVFPLKVIVRNIAAGVIVETLGIPEGSLFPQPTLEYRLKSDELKDPLLSDDQVLLMTGAMPDEIEGVRIMALRTNDFLSGMFAGVGVKLVEISLEFGRIYDEELGLDLLMITDEISPDTCRLWDMESGDKLDKDRFRQGMDKVEHAYQEIARRLGVLID